MPFLLNGAGCPIAGEPPAPATFFDMRIKANVRMD